MAVILNTITNSSFEAGLSGWLSQDVSIVATPTNEGFAAALLQGGALNPFLIQSVPATPGDTFELLLSIGRDAAGTTPIVSISIAYYDAGNVLLGFGLLDNIRVPDAAVQIYQLIDSITSPAPAGTVRAQLTITRLGATGSAAIFVDQVVLKQVVNDASGAVPILYPAVPTALQQTEESIELPEFPAITEVLRLDVTTVEPNQRVKIDAYIETTFVSLSTGTTINNFMVYILQRDDQQLMTISPNETLAVLNSPPFNLNLAYTIFPGLTYTDVVPEPGVHTYNVIALLGLDVTDIILAQTRAINAIVFPPARECVC